MKPLLPILAALTLLHGVVGCRTPSHAPTPTHGPIAADILAGTTAADWRRPDPAHTLVLDIGNLPIPTR